MIRIDEKTFWYFDENQMILENMGWGDGGKGDSVGRNAFAYICYPNESWLKDTILQCIKMRDDGYLQFYRYPGEGGSTMSRDHVGAIILALYINRDKDELKWVLDNIPWRISRKYAQTIDFWLWHRALKYEKWRWEISQLFYLITILQFIFILPWNFLWRMVLGVKKIKVGYKYDWWHSWKRKANRLIYPHYALFLLAWQIRVLSNSWMKRIIQYILRIESGNVVIDAILGKELNDNIYKPTLPFIWSRRMDSSDDIEIRYMSPEECEYNDLNQAMLDYLYFGIDKIMLEYDNKIVQAIKNKKEIIQYGLFYYFMYNFAYHYDDIWNIIIHSS